MSLKAADHGNVATSFVVFSDDWGSHPSSCQHLFRRIAKRYHVLWVNTIGMRHPTMAWTDLKKAFRKVLRMVRVSHPNPRSKADKLSLWVCQPFMLPWNSITLVRKLNRYSVRCAVRRYAGRLNISHPIMVSTVPNACDYVGGLEERKVIYYCVDDFTKWPGLEQHLIDAMERELIGKANVVVVTSQKLYRKLIMNNKPTHLLTHGVDISMFAHTAPTEHDCLEGIPRPRVGFFGLIDQRTNQGLIAAIASKMTDFSFVMTGPIGTDIGSLQPCSNIHFTGPVAYPELPALIKGLDVLFIPYLVNDFTASISPLKLKEYLVTGKPVIATPMPEAILQAQYVTIASSVDEWEVALYSALSVDVTTRRQAILELLAGESWDHKTVTFLTHCTDSGELNEGLAHRGSQL